MESENIPAKKHYLMVNIFLLLLTFSACNIENTENKVVVIKKSIGGNIIDSTQYETLSETNGKATVFKYFNETDTLKISFDLSRKLITYSDNLDNNFSTLIDTINYIRYQKDSLKIISGVFGKTENHLLGRFFILEDYGLVKIIGSGSGSLVFIPLDKTKLNKINKANESIKDIPWLFEKPPNRI